ncbi:hypothetical protein PBI_KESHU_96 [Mycobacterium phage Keshu]|uniref:Uncharacterized protein n=5 Tax=Keshuvirus TaxID=2948781 RepID=G1D503_9CAUD|nr:hypothetical protein PBI_KESHU_96 [Mycobacterium phage Keshu]YP_009202726.1 hypothetical protein SEA_SHEDLOCKHOLMES_95 [Mycobacterium phage ShedlockHolmes]YP_009637432.1 hypothetical protein FGG30_gp094 [Mycobacterium phage Pixie]YP_009951762.1 hypothetical protein I5G83_gp92 [Mycobacterium phage Hurricane]AOT23830.1 hypothetical protein SEA_TBOND007_91 [Mycobacterium phage TBond007]AEK09904.1 hypothetical protein PBI_PIXIE_94 [Mycobacterium phage Pixie]AJD82316.1 hypothetical protein PBI_
MQKPASKIAETTAEALLAVFAGETVTMDQIAEVLQQQYALARKRVAFGSYVQVYRLIEAAGATSRYTGPNYTGVCLYTFPAA